MICWLVSHLVKYRALLTKDLRSYAANNETPYLKRYHHHHHHHHRLSSVWDLETVYNLNLLTKKIFRFVDEIMVFSYTMVTLEILLREWQQNHRASWLLESAKINIVLHNSSSETVQIWLKWTRKIFFCILLIGVICRIKNERYILTERFNYLSAVT